MAFLFRTFIESPVEAVLEVGENGVDLLDAKGECGVAVTHSAPSRP